MTKHCKYSPYVSDAIDGELSEKMKARLMRHMETCVDCRKMYERFAMIDKEIGTLCEIDPSMDFNRRFWRALDAQRGKKFRLSFAGLFSGWRPALATAAVLMIIFGTVMLHGNRFFNKDIPADNPASELVMAENLDLFEDYDMIDNLPMLEHFDEISAMGGNS